MSDQDTARKRKADLYTSIVLLALALAMMGETLTFPMKDSYGGVDNVWYVSPALFPLLVAGSLVILAIVLMRRAIADGGAKRAWNDRHALVDGWRNEGTQRLAIIVACIAAFVYGLVSYVDFFLASMLFLGAFIIPFYVDRRSLFAPTLCGLIGTGLIAFICRRDGALSGTTLDTLVLVTFVVMAIVTRTQIRGDVERVRKWRAALWVSMLTPLILVPAFKFGLLVPLPVEGLVIDAMSEIARSLSSIL